MHAHKSRFRDVPKLFRSNSKRLRLLVQTSIGKLENEPINMQLISPMHGQSTLVGINWSTLTYSCLTRTNELFLHTKQPPLVITVRHINAALSHDNQMTTTQKSQDKEACYHVTRIIVIKHVNSLLQTALHRK